MGRNGAGKSTTMKAIMGLLARKRGRVAFRGHDIRRAGRTGSRRLGLGFVPEDRRMFTDLTVMENLESARQPPRDGAPAVDARASSTSSFPTSARCPIASAAA